MDTSSNDAISACFQYVHPCMHPPTSTKHNTEASPFFKTRPLLEMILCAQ